MYIMHYIYINIYIAYNYCDSAATLFAVAQSVTVVGRVIGLS